MLVSHFHHREYCIWYMHTKMGMEKVSQTHFAYFTPCLSVCLSVCLLTDLQDQTIERLQSQALKSIFGFGVSYSDMREMAGVPTLRARRIELVDKFIEKARCNPKYDRWFPKRTGRQGRNREEYLEITARTDRLNNTPLFFFRRRLNGKEGKVYGERNREYRDT